MTSAPALSQSYKIIDLGWRYNDISIDGYAVITNTTEDTINIHSIKGSEDDVITYSPVNIKLLPGQSVIAHYRSKVLHRIFQNDSSIICNYEQHRNKDRFRVTFKIYSGTSIDNLTMHKVNLKPKPESINNLSFCEKTDSDKSTTSDNLLLIPDLCSIQINRNSKGQYVYQGYIIFQFQSSDSKLRTSEPLSLETKLSGVRTKDQHIEHVFGNNYGQDYMILRVYFTTKKKLKPDRKVYLKTAIVTEKGTPVLNNVTTMISDFFSVDV